MARPCNSGLIMLAEITLSRCLRMSARCLYTCSLSRHKVANFFYKRSHSGAGDIMAFHHYRSRPCVHALRPKRDRGNGGSYHIGRCDAAEDTWRRWWGREERKLQQQERQCRWGWWLWRSLTNLPVVTWTSLGQTRPDSLSLGGVGSHLLNLGLVIPGSLLQY